ncbi:MAG: ACT domain-containing protein [Verrucomicrobia bacterium]|nr:MAG: ACT domain-containing protein [Verrucomicrobiota bacterium]
MSHRYFQIHGAEAISDDLLLIHDFMKQEVSDNANPLAPVVHWRNDLDRGGNTVRICTWDRAGLFGKIAGSLSAIGLNILSAQIFTRADGVALDSYFVTDARTGTLATTDQREKFEKLLTRVLGGEEVDLAGLIARQKISQTPYQAYAGDHIPTQILFDNEASETRTLIEVETEDRVGVLYAIVQTLAELDLNITAARICTEKGAAIDTFYVHEVDDGKILSPERQHQVARQLRRAIQALEKNA